MYKDHLRGHTASVPKLISPDCNCKIDLSDLQKRKEHMISIHGIDISTNPNVECDCKLTYAHVRVSSTIVQKKDGDSLYCKLGYQSAQVWVP